MIEIADKKIGSTTSTFIIAEAGVNHNGNIEAAKKLIDEAAEAGADAVKFQTFKTEDLVTKEAPKAKYQKKVASKQETQYEMLKKLELTRTDHNILKEYCKEKDIIFMSTPFDFKSVDLLERMEVEVYKVGSGDLTNLPLLKYIAKKNKPIILSTGMSNLGEVEEAVNTILKTGNSKLILLHCVSNYPAEYKNVNLKAMDTMRQAFKLLVGYSDHTLGIKIPIAAVAKGAVVIEKHFTLDNNMEGPDHSASLEPHELSEMVNAIRKVEKSLGDGIKRITKSEKRNVNITRKGIVARRNIEAGQNITQKDLAIKRPQNGILPKYFNNILGKVVNKEIEKGKPVKWEDINRN